MLGPDPQDITAEHIQSSPYASLYVQQDNNPQALLVLAWAEKIQKNKPVALKWLSSNNEMLVTQSGRIIKTVNLPKANLIALHADSPDPLSIGLHKTETSLLWEFELTWQPNNHIRYPAISEFTIHGEVDKTLPNGVHRLLHVSESINIPIIEQQYQNEYWLDPVNGKVIASEQIPAPTLPKLGITIAKPYSGSE